MVILLFIHYNNSYQTYILIQFLKSKNKIFRNFIFHIEISIYFLFYITINIKVHLQYIHIYIHSSFFHFSSLNVFLYVTIFLTVTR